MVDFVVDLNCKTNSCELRSIEGLSTLNGFQQLSRFIGMNLNSVLENLITRRSIPDSQLTQSESIPVKILSISLTRGKSPRLGNVNQSNLFLKLIC